MALAWFIVRLLAVTAGFAALHYYLWWRLCRDTTEPGSRWRPTGAVIIGVLALFGLLARFLTPSDAPLAVQAAAGYPGLIWFGLFLYLFGLLVVGEALRFILIRRARRHMTEAEIAADRADGFWHHLRSILIRLRLWPRPATPTTANTSASPSESPDPARAATDTTTANPVEDPKSAPPASDVRPQSPPADAGPTHRPAEAILEHAASEQTPKPDASSTSHATPEAGAAPTAHPSNTSHGTGQSRRRLMSQAIGLSASALAVATVGHGLYEGYRTPPLKPVTVNLARLPRQFDGYRIAVVGDTHFSAIRGRGYCERVVDQINRAQADLIAFVGDLASNEADQVRDATDPLAGLQARDGTFFVAGNAEHYVGADEWYDRVEELGMIGLPNTRVELPGFDLAGVNDLIVEQRHIDTETGPDFEAALGDRDPSRPVILLAHQPNAVDRIADYGVDLQLSGHTHGGQMWPVHYASLIRSGQLTGLELHGDTQVYVTNGAGTNGPPIRVGADADITVMTLRAGSS
ncbi:metallophosphoesterase [Glycomyces algeriensis]|uniref:Membrane protein n=1 Tax=Glycomyces algeriensis TaxID=256037 RepID=A0A9W6GDA3_9ACTN|nr:metallophosphoesterase [Glycomyces algeriensis]MDA1368190.1 metallophosphoesterase [Glycomyces algeriensis]MDR7351830.1 putative MPP superfamily phosphohydrolase [Glycomyces algeriensis]GLI44558.1 membrane protein [Glycomyces algeriensis]